MLVERLKKPYPLVSRLRDQVLVSALFGLFIFLFLLFFQPFGLGEMNVSKAIYVFGFGLITTCMMVINYSGMLRIFPRIFDPDAWTVGKEIAFGLWIITLISLTNYGYHTLVTGLSTDFGAIMAYIIITASVGMFPLTILVFVKELYLNNSHQRNALIISQQIETRNLTTHAQSPGKKVLIGSQANDALEICEDTIRFIQAQDNYCLVHFLDGESVLTQLIRITLKEVEVQLESNENIVRCHRSYLVNKQKILKITGNARAYSIHFENSDDQIPVSRGISKDSFFDQ